MADNKRDYYQVLGLTRQADAKAIRDAFRQLALKYHPDRNKEPGAEAHFKEIAEAYAVLSDPKKRADYDAGGFGGLKGMRPEDLFGGIDFGDLFGGMGFGAGGDLFERFFGQRGRDRHGGPARGANIEALLQVSLERVSTGGDELVSFERLLTCPVCKGKRARPGTSPRTCETCHGSGQEVRESRHSGVQLKQILTCGACGGAGEFIDQPCSECQGQGQVRHTEQITVNIPPGCEERMVLRVPGHGLPAPSAEGQAGDLLVNVRTRPDPRFARDGADLWCTRDLSVSDAVLGRELQLPTLDGTAQIQVPPGTQPDTVLRLRGKGLPYFGQSGHGDLLLKLRVTVPTKLSAAQRTLYQQLRGLT